MIENSQEEKRAVAPDWCFDPKASPEVRLQPDGNRDRILLNVGSICVQWSDFESKLQLVTDCLLGAFNPDIPNSKPIADAIFSSHRNTKSKFSLIRNLTAIVLLRQPDLHRRIMELLRKADGVAEHRNAVVHGSLVDFQIDSPEGQRVNRLVLRSPWPKDSHRPFPTGVNARKPDFSKKQTASYDFDATKDIIFAIAHLQSETNNLVFNSYMQGLGNRTILPSQGNVGY